jgi:probable rRNA maturation factor
MPDNVAVSNRQRRFRIDAGQLGRAVERVLEIAGAGGQEVSVLLVSDRAMRGLNRDYRGKDEPTDVLSFSMREGEWGDVSGTMLGDLVISLETVSRQAGIEWDDDRPVTGTPRRELALMTIHGLLHLLGHEHERGKKKAEQMRLRECELFGQAWEWFPEFELRR